MKLGPCIAALAVGVLVLSACEDDDVVADNEYRETTLSPYPDSPPAMSTTPAYPSTDPNTIPPTTNPDAPVSPDGTLPPTIPPATTPPT